MRNGRDPKFTARANGLVMHIASSVKALLALRHSNGMPAMQFLSGIELEPLDILDDVIAQRDKWHNTRERQGRFSQQQKLIKRAEKLRSEALDLEVRAKSLEDA